LLAENLPKLDVTGTIDAFITLEFCGIKYESIPVTAVNKKCPIQFEFWIPL
jgi:hypothetical protein